MEDDRGLSNGICIALQGEDTRLDQSFDIASAKNKLESNTFDLLILDINLPDGSGLDFLNEINQNEVNQNLDISKIILAANDLETDIVTGLESGADDYITKPFSLAVLRARVNAQLRKQSTKISGRYEFDEFIFDFDSMRFFKNSVPIELSKTEQKLLKILIENKGATLKRATLVDRIWSDGAAYVDENALSVTVKRLRDKLEDTPSSPFHIKTVYGLGYTWVVR